MDDINIRSMNLGTDGSGIIAAGGTSQDLFTTLPGKIPVNGYEVINPDPTEDMWITDTAAAAVANGTGNIRIAANGGAYWTVPNCKPLGIVRIVAATTGHKFTARCW